MKSDCYTIDRIAAITGGEISGPDPEQKCITHLLTDSRRLVNPDHCLFVALTTERNDGHRYIPELLERGVQSFLVTPGGWGRGGVFIEVPDTLAALQKLAAYHRRQFSGPVIGITGSNGKTIVKEWLFQLLSPDQRIVRSPKSYNSQVGVPLSVWKISPDDTLAIFEAGISLPGEMERLEEIIQPTIGIITNIGAAHDEYFTSRKEKAAEKLKLFTRSKKLVYCSGYPEITECLRETEILKSVDTFTWSATCPADLVITGTEKTNGSTVISAVYKERPVTFTIPFTDKASVENSIHCAALLLVVGYPAEEISRRMRRLTPIAMRLEMKEAINRCSLINDSYNSDIHSLEIALDFLIQQKQHPKKCLILSDILESGRNREDLYREVGNIVRTKQVDRFIGIGRDLMAHRKHFAPDAAFFESTGGFLERFPFSAFQDEAILLKGARVFEFEKIDQALQHKAHETVLEINLDAMIHNLNHFRAKLKPRVRTMAMVKAFSYGSGSYEIANLLQFHRADYLAVAYTDEGVELRKSGITLPVMVMDPEENSLEAVLLYNLEPEIYSFRILKLLKEAITKNGTTPVEKLPVHIKFDTGMHRLGFCEEDLPELKRQLAESGEFMVKSVFSHLAASEDPSQDTFTRMQFSRFERMSEDISEVLSYPVLRHILNSAGISRFPEAQYDMVRLGIGLYGVGADPEEQAQLRNVSTLRSIITQIKRVKADETIGYNRAGIASEDMMIAVVPVGYADGVNRKLGNGKGRFFIKGKPVPLTGNVCMDLCMVDITELATRGTDVSEGDEVIIFGDCCAVSEMARTLETIPYEILTGISRRVKRVYYHE
jgi:alanine racemase